MGIEVNLINGVVKQEDPDDRGNASTHRSTCGPMTTLLATKQPEARVRTYVMQVHSSPGGTPIRTREQLRP